MQSMGSKGKRKPKQPSQSRAIPGFPDCGQGGSSPFQSLPEGKNPLPCEELYFDFVLS